MDHLQESGASIRRRRRRRRAAITLTLVTLLMLVTFTYAAAYFQGWVGSRVPKAVASPNSTACQPVNPGKALAPRSVMVNVYNSTDRAGLAAIVAKSLRTQGFKVAAVTNDPLGRSIIGIGEIRHGPTGVAAATLAATRLSGGTLVLDNRTDATVDVVLGVKFRSLSVPPRVSTTKPSKTAPSPSPSPSTAC